MLPLCAASAGFHYADAFAAMIAGAVITLAFLPLRCHAAAGLPLIRLMIFSPRRRYY
jgi:hypothetical protein